jgi:penicillin-binding protein 1A
LQEGLAHYEMSSGRTLFRGPEANIADAIQKLNGANPGGATGGAPGALPAWQQALQAVRLPLSDVHWDPAIVLDKGGKRGDGVIRVGLRDGRVLPLNLLTAQVRRALNLYDVVYVHVTETRPPPKPRNAAGAAVAAPAIPVGGQAQLRVRPTVQGAALVLENKTGRILAMAGSFSYTSSQLNRTAQTQRQPGSAMKPLTYLTALQTGLQPNTLVPNDPLKLPPVGIPAKARTNLPEEYFWSPRNADNGSGGVYTLRRGLENSVNVVTAHLLDGGISVDPEKSLDQVCATAVAAKIYSTCVRYYPFVLGAQPVRMINLAAFYAAVANEGALPRPHAIESIEADGNVVFQYPNAPLPFIGAADRTAFYQLKTMLQGVVARGTARAIGALSPYVAGKTGTTEDAVDGWFVGFTNDVTIAVWVGYDNGEGKRHSLGGSATGAGVALPIFEPIIQAIWAEGIAPKTPLNGPSPEAKRHLIDLPIDYASGSRVAGGGFIEHFRLDADGKVKDTQNQIKSNHPADDRPVARAKPPCDQFDSRDSAQAENDHWLGGWGWGSDGGWRQQQIAARGAPTRRKSSSGCRQPLRSREWGFSWGGNSN